MRSGVWIGAIAITTGTTAGVMSIAIGGAARSEDSGEVSCVIEQQHAARTSVSGAGAL